MSPSAQFIRVQGQKVALHLHGAGGRALVAHGIGGPGSEQRRHRLQQNSGGGGGRGNRSRGHGGGGGVIGGCRGGVVERSEASPARGAGAEADDAHQQPQDHPEGLHERAQARMRIMTMVVMIVMVVMMMIIVVMMSKRRGGCLPEIARVAARAQVNLVQGTTCIHPTSVFGLAGDSQGSGMA